MKQGHYFFITIFLISSIYGQNYHWPTIGSKAMSSNFGEFRDGGYHMGIDIKTRKPKLYTNFGGQYMLLMTGIFLEWFPIFQDMVKDYT